MARDAGYRDLEEILRSGETLKAGDKVYAVNMNKMLALFRIGERPISEGMNILGAHIDSPRIDVKQNPLYENEELAYETVCSEVTMGDNPYKSKDFRIQVAHRDFASEAVTV